jgi:succinyl-diaminopimelate desuccinylase
MKADGDNIHLTSTGVSAHGSKPEDGKNAVAYMVSFLNTLPLVKNYLSDTVYHLAKHVGVETDGRAMGIANSDESGALTLNLGYIRTDRQGVKLGLDIRYPVSSDGSAIMRKMLGVFDGFDVDVPFSLPSHFVSEDSGLVTGLKQAYEEITGGPASCKTMGGATYARAFPNAVAFGPLFRGRRARSTTPTSI